MKWFQGTSMLIVVLAVREPVLDVVVLSLWKNVTVACQALVATRIDCMCMLRRSALVRVEERATRALDQPQSVGAAFVQSPVMHRTSYAIPGGAGDSLGKLLSLEEP